MNCVKLLLAAGLLLSVAACNTVAGLGKDVQEGGAAIEKSAK